jgi:hypothetical protein
VVQLDRNLPWQPKFVFGDIASTAADLPRPTDSANAFRPDVYRFAALFGECLDLERRGRPTADFFEEKS